LSKKIFANNNPDAYAIVDDDVFEIIQNMNLKFSIMNKGYFILTKWIQLPGMEKKKQLLLHRFVYILKTGTEPMSSIDHKDINSSNNQFSNLRLATRQEQIQHRNKYKNNTSGLIGVSRLHRVNKHYKNGYRDYWRAQIHKSDGKIEVKTFPFTPEGKIAAGKWHDQKAREYFGKFCGELNFPDEIG
jgi:hypothetical protein